MQPENLPVSHPRKKDGLEMHDLSGQFVIYEAGSDSIHYLNPTAVLVLEFCDGTRSPAAIAELLRQAYALAEAPVDEVDGCLETLKTIGLVA
jgi:Coenzyme PQQ synthesis protein D (PqqD)